MLDNFMFGNKVNFKKAKIPSKKILNGKYAILEPININKHSKNLYVNFLKDKKNRIWNYLPYGPFKSYGNFKKWLRSFCLGKEPFFYAIYAKRYGQYCGMASYLRITPDHGTIEVGHINYSPILQNTAEGTEAMYLMMKNVFENLGYRRYEWKCDTLNKKSKRSALRLGFKFEGVFRQATIYKKRNRDSAWFSIIDKEWKSRKKKYLEYLKRSNFDENLREYKKL